MKEKEEVHEEPWVVADLDSGAIMRLDSDSADIIRIG